MNNIYHYTLISLLNVPWETFTARDMFRGPQIPPSMVQETGEPSTHVEIAEENKETKNVEGILPSTSTK